MFDALHWALILLWSAWVTQAFLSVLQVRKLANRLLREPPGAGTLGHYEPNVVVIVPFKGFDADLPGCIGSLCNQNYNKYQLMLVVESPNDPAYPVMMRELAKHPDRKADVLMCGQASRRVGQKVHNQLFAIDKLEPEANDQDVWVFADSDAVPGPNWLPELVGPLRDTNKIGMTTGYRWMIPEPAGSASENACCAGFWSSVASVMNSSVACIYRQKDTSRAWGGAMALRVQTARRGKLREHLAGSISDDYQCTKMIGALGLRIWFLPRCLVATTVQFTLAGLVEFARRQYTITRIYSPWSFVGALAVMTLWVAGFFSSLIALATALVRPCTHSAFVLPVLVMLAVMTMDQVRASYRGKVVRLAFGQDVLRQLRLPLTIDRWLTPFWMTLHWLLIVLSIGGRVIRWRNVAYRLDGPQNIHRLDA